MPFRETGSNRALLRTTAVKRIHFPFSKHARPATIATCDHSNAFTNDNRTRASKWRDLEGPAQCRRSAIRWGPRARPIRHRRRPARPRFRRRRRAARPPARPHAYRHADHGGEIVAAAVAIAALTPSLLRRRLHRFRRFIRRGNVDRAACIPPGCLPIRGCSRRHDPRARCRSCRTTDRRRANPWPA